ncbi:MAG TPA: hypothetical protein EYP03_05615 [Aquificae bacterium]|nr:hypothetical protein [Aquificota bacterium]
MRNLKILIAGYNDISKNLIEEIKPFYEVYLLEKKEKKEFLEKENLEGVNFILGDISDVDTLKQIISNNFNVLIATCEEDRLNYGICKFLFNHIPNKIILLNHGVNKRFYEDIEKEIVLIEKGKVLGKYIKNYLDPNKKEGISIGIGKDIIQIKVLPSSILANQKVARFSSSKWKIVAIYRDNKIILPRGNTVILPGDQVLFIGEPKILESTISLFLKNEPQFPLDYGYAQVVILKDIEKNYLKENLFLYSKTKVREIDFYFQENEVPKDKLEKILKELPTNKLLSYKVIKNLDEVDIGFISLKKKNFKLKMLSYIFTTKNALPIKLFNKYAIPVFLCIGKEKYENILCPIFNMEESIKALETAFQIAKMMGANLHLLLIKQADIVENSINLHEIKKHIDFYKRIYKLKANIIHKTGNPVKITSQISKDYDLVVTSSKIGKYSTLFKPYPPHLIFLFSKSSSLLVPYPA